MFENIGIGEIAVVMLFVVVFFGAKKIPEIAKGLGAGIREFKKAARDIQQDVQNESKPVDDKGPQQPPPANH
ncbi:MAG TPA: twin-arginine translocase TatA/TatE family subunit [Bacteroidota bacterium]|nr:twin-arginine translocase TatA/TatE family subunit [Bacteroidota bacterium]